MDTPGSNNIGINLYTDASGIDPGIAHTEQKLDELKSATMSYQEMYGETVAQTQSKLNAFSIAQDNARDKAWALANGYKDVGGSMVKMGKTVEEVAGGVHVNSLAMRESLVLVREAARGNWSRMAGSASILAQSLGGLSLLMNPIVLGVAAVGAAVAGGIYWWEKYGESLEDVHAQLASVADDGLQNLENKIALQNQTLSRMVSMSQKTGLSHLSDAEANRLGVLNLQVEVYTTRLNHAKRGTDEFAESTRGLAKAQEGYNKLVQELADRKSLEQQNKGNGRSGSSGGPNAKLLADVQRFDTQMVESGKDAFSKRLDDWVAMQQKMEASGIYYGKMRLDHEAALDALTTAEYNKHTAANAAAEKKTAAAEAQHQASIINSEKNYYARIQAMADAADQFSGGKKNLQYNKELITLNAWHKKAADAVKNDHAASLAEENRYQIALGNLKQAYAIQTFTAETSITAMISAFNDNNRAAEIESTLGYFEKLSSYGASHHRGMFELNKIAAEANAIVKTAEGIAGVLGDYPGPVGWVMAAAQALLGLEQIDAIESAQFGGGAASTGGGGIPSMATSPGLPVSNVAPAVSPPPPPGVPVQATQQLNYTIIGAKDNPDKGLISFNTAVAMMAAINRAGARGHKINATVIAA